MFSVLLPEGELFRGRVKSVVAPGAGGSRGFLPRHIDFVTSLQPASIVTCVLEDGSERFFAVQGGVLVKKGDELTVTTRRALMADDLAVLPDLIEETFAEEEEHERLSRRVLHQLEAQLVREFLEWAR